MTELASSARLPLVTSSAGDETDRGAAIQRRFDALGMSDREWHAKTGIDRKTLNRAIRNEPGTRASTYTAIESHLDRFEARDAGLPTAMRPIGNPDDDLVEVIFDDNRVVVKGPVRSIAALEALVARVMEGRREHPNG